MSYLLWVIIIIVYVLVFVVYIQSVVIFKGGGVYLLTVV